MSMGDTSTGSTLGALGLVVALLGGVAGLSHLAHGKAAHADGREAPDFTLPLVANAAALGSQADAPTVHMKDLLGRPVLLDFWATWCGPCRAEAPIVDRVSRRWRDRGVVVVGVSADMADDPRAGDPRAFATAHGLSYPIATDRDGVAQQAYEVDSLPTLVVVSRTGKIVAVRSGVTDDVELERLIKEAM